MASLQPLAFFGKKAADTYSFFGEDSLYSLKAVRKSFIVIIFVEKNLLHISLFYLGPIELLGIQWVQNGNWIIHVWPPLEAVLNLQKIRFIKKIPKSM